MEEEDGVKGHLRDTDSGHWTMAGVGATHRVSYRKKNQLPYKKGQHSQEMAVFEVSTLGIKQVSPRAQYLIIHIPFNEGAGGSIPGWSKAIPKSILKVPILVAINGRVCEWKAWGERVNPGALGCSPCPPFESQSVALAGP